jgi:hypothetical protein
MKTITKYRSLTALYILMIMAIFILPVFSGAAYSLTSPALNLQGVNKIICNLIMNSILASLAITSVISGWNYFEDFGFQRIILLLSGLSVIMAAVFNSVPVSSQPNADTRAAWFLYFLSTASLAFITLFVSTAFILERKRERIMSVAAAATILVFSFLMLDPEKTAGLWQKAILITAYGWMVLIFRKKES